MGYFPNGTAGMDYEDRYCSRCIHNGTPDGPGCAIWLAHLLHNYKECNNKKSILHLLIPRSEGGLDNDQCKLFVESDKVYHGKLPEHLKEWAKQHGILEVPK